MKYLFESIRHNFLSFSNIPSPLSQNRPIQLRRLSPWDARPQFWNHQVIKSWCLDAMACFLGWRNWQNYVKLRCLGFISYVVISKLFNFGKRRNSEPFQPLPTGSLAPSSSLFCANEVSHWLTEASQVPLPEGSSHQFSFHRCSSEPMDLMAGAELDEPDPSLRLWLSSWTSASWLRGLLKERSRNKP